MSRGVWGGRSKDVVEMHSRLRALSPRLPWREVLGLRRRSYPVEGAAGGRVSVEARGGRRRVGPRLPVVLGWYLDDRCLRAGASSTKLVAGRAGCYPRA